MSLVDIVIPTRNRLAFTLRAIASVRRQTFEDWRLWIVDDSSDDGSVSELEDATAPDPRIVVIRRASRGGPAASRQTGFAAGKSPMVSILDSDDIWRPTKLAIQVDLLSSWRSRHPDLVGCFSGHVWSDYSERRKRQLESAPGAASIVRNPTVTTNMSSPLFFRSALEAAGGFLPPGGRALSTAEGIELFVRLTQFGPLLRHDAVLVECIRHESNRASDGQASLMGAEELAYVVSAHRHWLEQWPADLSQLLARTGARMLAANQAAKGIAYLREAWHVAPPKERLRLARRYGPFAAKQVVATLRHRHR